MRYYEREKLIIPHRDNKNCRYYTKDDIKWIGFLMHLKGTGMSMNEIKEYVYLREQGNKTILKRKDLLERVKKRSLSEIEEMQNHLEILSYKIDWYSKKLNHFDHYSESFEEYLDVIQQKEDEL